MSAEDVTKAETWLTAKAAYASAVDDLADSRDAVEEAGDDLSAARVALEALVTAEAPLRILDTGSAIGVVVLKVGGGVQISTTTIDDGS